MGGSVPSPFSNSFKGQSINSLRYNTSQKGSPICICCGTKRVPVNLIDGFGFKSSGGSRKGGGKGGSKSSKKGGAQYSVNADFALCMGPVAFSGAPYAPGGDNRVWSNGVASVTALPLNFYTGADGQSADPVFASSGDPPVLGYSGTAHVTGTPIDLGSSPALPNIQVEVTGFGVGTSGTDFPGDVRPDWLVVDICTNTRYGVGVPFSEIDTGGAWDGGGSVADWGHYCQAAGIAMSYLFDRQQPAAHWIQDIVDQTSAAIFESSGIIKVIPYAEAALNAHGTTWTPNLTAVYDFTDSDFIDFGGGSDPVILNRTDPRTIPNWINAEFEDGTNSYNKESVPVFDQEAIDAYGLNVDPSFLADGFTNVTGATVSAQIHLDRKQRIRNTYKLKLGWRYWLLEPMDIVRITDAHLGLSNEPVRITQIDEDDNGELTITAEQLGLGIVTAPNRVIVSGSALFDPLADPGDANPPIIFEPPTTLTGGNNEAWIVATGGPDWGGCYVLISTDGTTYGWAGTIDITGGRGRQGVLTAALASHADPDSTNTLSVDLTQSQGQLLSGSLADADDHVTLCYVNGELLSYETATLTSAYHYGLTYLRRGAYGTTIAAHSIGDRFARVGPNDASVFRYQYPANFIGKTIHVKLQSFNIFAQGLQDVSLLTADTYTLTGAGSVSSTSVPIQFLGTPQSGAPITRYTFDGPVILPAGLSGSICTAGVAATALTTFDIAKNGSNVGTMSVAASATTATFVMGSTQSFVVGDVLTLTPTSTDATLAVLSGILVGTNS